MSQAKLAAAHELFHEKQYDAARVVLETIKDNPTAQEWLESIEQIKPKAKPVTSMTTEELLANLNENEARKEILHRGSQPGSLRDEVLRLIRQELKNERFQEWLIPIAGTLDDIESVPILVEIRQKDIEALKKNGRSNNESVQLARYGLGIMKNLDAEIACHLQLTMSVKYLHLDADTDKVIIAEVSGLKEGTNLITVIVSQVKSKIPNGWELEWKLTRANLDVTDLLTLALRKATQIAKLEQDKQIEKLMDDNAESDLSSAFPDEEMYHSWSDNHF